MKKRPFAIIALAILIMQPVIITTGFMSTALNPVLSDQSRHILTQDLGTRLLPEEHTNHVPIHINGTSEFSAQNWDGSGTSGDPFVISGLNITYAFPDYLIKITNTDAYFIIEDCFVMQLSSTSGILFENVTHGTIQYTTVYSEGEGLICENADNTVVDHVQVDSLDGYAVYINYSSGFQLSHSLLNSSQASAVFVNSSHSSEFSDSVFDSEFPYIDLDILYSDDVEVLNAEFHISSTEFRAWHCTNLRADGLIAGSGSYGIEIDYCENVEISNADIIADSTALNIYYSNDTYITESTFSTPTGLGQSIFVYYVNNVTFNHILVNDTMNNGMQIGYSEHVGIEYSQFSYFDNAAVDITYSNYTDIKYTEFQDGFNGIQEDHSFWTNISSSTFYNVYGEAAIQSGSSDNGTIAHNVIMDGYEGMFLVSNYNWRVHDNILSDLQSGIRMLAGSHTDIWHNQINNITSTPGRGMEIQNHQVIEIWENTISNCEGDGMYLEDCDDQFTRDNVISNCENGIYILGTINSTINTNIISNSFGTGIEIIDSETTEFKGNNISYCEKGFNITDSWRLEIRQSNLIMCGFIFGYGSETWQFNHTIEDNLVNQKPLYYGFNGTGLSINGNLYGEVILAFCNDSTITGGDFNHSTVGILLYSSHRNHITDVRVTNEIFCVLLYISHNNTLSDIEIETCSTDYSIWLWDSANSIIEDLVFRNIEGDGIFINVSFNTTVQYCEFQDIEGAAISVDFLSPTDYSDALIFNNTFVNATYGVFGHAFSTTMNISYNDFMWCDIGIYTDYADFSHFANNYFHDNGHGMHLYNTWDVYVYNNTYIWNDIGLELEDDSGVDVFYNVFAPHFEYGGYDDAANIWDDGVDTGNWWYDFKGTIPYSVPGPGSAVDNYPMGYVFPTEPIINTPIDISFPEGSTGNVIRWLPIDDYLRDWVVTVDGDNWDSGIWNFDSIIVNFDELPYGEYDATITVWDVDLHSVSDTVHITVYDDTPPEIEGPANTELFVDADGQTLEWLVSDLHPATYEVMIGILEYDTGTWTSGTLVIDADNIAVGIHEVQVTIFDVDGNFARDNVTVRVINDDTDPTIDSPEDIIYMEGTIGNVIEWSPEDDYPDFYQVAFNGSVIDTHSWGGSRVIVSVDGLSPGTYEYELRVYDLSGGMASDIVNVTVIPIIPPEVPLTFDWLVVVLVGAALAGVVAVVAIILYMRKRTPSG